MLHVLSLSVLIKHEFMSSSVGFLEYHRIKEKLNLTVINITPIAARYLTIMTTYDQKKNRELSKKKKNNNN